MPGRSVRWLRRIVRCLTQRMGYFRAETAGARFRPPLVLKRVCQNTLKLAFLSDASRWLSRTTPDAIEFLGFRNSEAGENG